MKLFIKPHSHYFLNILRKNALKFLKFSMSIYLLVSCAKSETQHFFNLLFKHFELKNVKYLIVPPGMKNFKSSHSFTLTYMLYWLIYPWIISPWFTIHVPLLWERCCMVYLRQVDSCNLHQCSFIIKLLQRWLFFKTLTFPAGFQSFLWQIAF